MVFHCSPNIASRAAAFSFFHISDDDFRELKVLDFNFRVIASIVLDEWIRRYCVVVVFIWQHVRVLEHHSVSAPK